MSNKGRVVSEAQKIKRYAEGGSVPDWVQGASDAASNIGRGIGRVLGADTDSPLYKAGQQIREIGNRARPSDDATDEQ